MPPIVQQARAPQFTIACAAVVWACGALIFFRFSWWSGFNLVPGSQSDTRLIVFLQEHVFQWLRGNAVFGSPIFFHPQPNVFGYSDGSLLNALFYSLFRLFGFDPFLSTLLWTAAASALCFAASAVIFTRYFGIRWPLALAGALLVTFPNNLYFKADHPHFYALYYIPVLVLIVLRGLEDFPRVTARLVSHFGAAALLYGLLFATSYYVAWQFAFTCLIALVAALCMMRRTVVDVVRANPGSVSIVLAVAAAALIVGLIPFYLIYEPVLQAFPRRSYRDYVAFAPFPIDAFNVTIFNLPWGWAVARLIGDTRYEAALAVTPAMVLMLYGGAWLALRGSLRARLAEWEKAFIAVSVAVVIASWLFTVRIGTVSGFWLVYQLIPGAGAIRVGGRIQLLVNLWVVAALVLVLDRILREKIWQNRTSVVVAAAVAVCLFEQVNTFNNARLPRKQELASLAAVPPPPAQCRSFLLASPSHPNEHDQNDAIWIAWRTALPTLNGSSGWEPPGWNLAAANVNYYAAARDWIARNGLTQVCLYDRAARTWSPFGPAG